MDTTTRRARTRLIVLTVLAALGTVVGYLAALVVTGFLGCGLFGCHSGGKVAYGPVEGQVGLVACGLVLVPLTMLLVRRGRRPLRLLAAGLAFVLGSAFAMLLIGLGPNGCPWGDVRTGTRIGFGPPETTCSGSPWSDSPR